MCSGAIGVGREKIEETPLPPSSLLSSSISSPSSSGTLATKGESGRFTLLFLCAPLRDSQFGGVSNTTEMFGSYRTGVVFAPEFSRSDGTRFGLGVEVGPESALSLSGERGATSSCLAPRFLCRAIHFSGGDGNGREVSFALGIVEVGLAGSSPVGSVSCCLFLAPRESTDKEVSFASGELPSPELGICSSIRSSPRCFFRVLCFSDGGGNCAEVSFASDTTEVFALSGLESCVPVDLPRLFRAVHFSGGDGNGKEMSFAAGEVGPLERSGLARTRTGRGFLAVDGVFRTEEGGGGVGTDVGAVVCGGEEGGDGSLAWEGVGVVVVVVVVVVVRVSPSGGGGFAGVEVRLREYGDIVLIATGGGGGESNEGERLPEFSSSEE